MTSVLRGPAVSVSGSLIVPLPSVLSTAVKVESRLSGAVGACRLVRLRVMTVAVTWPAPSSFASKLAETLPRVNPPAASAGWRESAPASGTSSMPLAAPTSLSPGVSETVALKRSNAASPCLASRRRTS